MIFKSIQTKIVLIAGLCLISAVTLLVGYGLFSSKSTQDVVSLEVSSLLTELNMERLQNLAGEQYTATICQDNFLRIHLPASSL